MKLLTREARRLWRPRKLKPPSEWLNENCELRDNITEQPGKMRVFPYCKEVLDNLIDPFVNKVTLCFGSQSGKTTHIYGGMAYLLCEFPKDTIWILPSADNARNFSKGRWLPFIEDCQALKDQCPISASSGKIDSDKITNMRQEFLSCTLTFAGAGSENNVKSAPIAYLVMDEIDEIDTDIRKAALERVKGRREHKVIQTSTPKEEDGIWSEYTKGDQRKYFMPCPHCGEHIDFQWRQTTEDGTRYGIAFDETARLEDGSWDFGKVAATAHYRCQHCDGEILDAHKPDMIRKGEWRAQNPHAPIGHRSYHLSSMYAPAITFASIMIKWLQESKDMAGLKKFVQGDLAEPWTDDWINQDKKDAHQLETDYDRGDLKGEFRLLLADTQQDHYRYVCRGYDRNGESYLIDFGSVPSFTDLDAIYSRFACHKGIIDSGGNRTQEVYEEIYRRRSNWFASKGWAKMQEPYRIQQKDPFTGDTKGRAGRSKIMFLHIDNAVWEPELAMLRSRQKQGFYTFAETPKEYYDQLFGPYWVRKPDRSGHIKTVKKCKRDDRGHNLDHYFDCEKQGLALAKFLGIGRVDRASDARVIGEQAPRKPVKRSSRSRSATSFW